MCVCASSLTVVDCVYRPSTKFKSNSDKQENVRIKTHDSHLSVLRYRGIFDFATYKHILNVILLLVLLENRFVRFFFCVRCCCNCAYFLCILFFQFYPATSANTSLVGWFFFSSCASNTFKSNKKKHEVCVGIYVFVRVQKNFFLSLNFKRFSSHVIIFSVCVLFSARNAVFSALHKIILLHEIVGCVRACKQ